MKLRSTSLFLVAAVCGCHQPVDQPLLCQVLARPDRYVGQELTLSGIAQMYQHESTLKRHECPDHVLPLDMLPHPIQVPLDKLPDAQFFTKLATKPQASVTVTGQLLRGGKREPHPYVFRVQSGIYK